MSARIYVKKKTPSYSIWRAVQNTYGTKKKKPIILQVRNTYLIIATL